MNTVEEVKTFSRSLNLLICSWNVGNAPPENIHHLLVGSQYEERGRHDLIVIGLQESTYQTVSEINESFSSNSAAPPNLPPSNRLNNNYAFSEPCILHMTNLIMGALGPEYDIGGLLVSLNVDGTSMAFVSCHLAAHEGTSRCQLRNDSIKEILGGVRPRDRRYDILSQFHHVFWMGDMNYRLTFSKDTPFDPILSSRGMSVGNASIRSTSTLDYDAAQSMNGLALKKIEEKKSMESSPKNQDFSNHGFSSDSNHESGTLDSPDGNEPIDYDDDSDDDKEVPTGGPNRQMSLKKQRLVHRIAEMNKIYRMICDGEWDELLKLDELNRELAAGRVLHGFTALQPRFPPTFKRIRRAVIQQLSDSTGIWDLAYHDMLEKKSSEEGKDSSPDANQKNFITRFYDRKRLPSYCDRILFKSWDCYRDNLQNESFLSCESMTSSDHKPVRASFTLQTTGGLKDIKVYHEEKLHQRTFHMLPHSHNDQHSSHAISHLQSNSMVFGVSSAHGSDRASDRPNNKYAHSHISNICKPESSYPLIESIIEEYHVKVASKMRFEFYNLQGENLAEMDSKIAGGGSDPYIIIQVDPPVLGYNIKYDKNSALLTACNCILYTNQPHEVMSPIIYHNVNPSWEDVLSLNILSSDVEAMANNLNFIISVWDHDRFNEDDLIGTCVISFKEVKEALSSSDINLRRLKFEKELLSQGIVMGKLKGMIRVPDRTLEYYIQDNYQLHERSIACEDLSNSTTTGNHSMLGRRNHHQTSTQSAMSVMSVGSSSPRGSEQRARHELDRNGSTMSVDRNNDSGCIVM